DGIDALQECASRLRVFRRPVTEPRGDLDHMLRQYLVQLAASAFDAEIQRIGYEVQLAFGRRRHVLAPAGSSGLMPASRSIAQVRISGRPTSAVGSSDSIASSSAMPIVSDFALPVQS